jgi:hypothetical protein
MTIEEARKMVDEDNARIAKEIEEKRLAYLEPIKAMVESEGYKLVHDACARIKAEFPDDGSFSVHLDALMQIMPRLAYLAGTKIS